jgi:hypothetical protein
MIDEMRTAPFYGFLDMGAGLMDQPAKMIQYRLGKSCRFLNIFIYCRAI